MRWLKSKAVGAGDFTDILRQMLPPNLIAGGSRNGQMLGLIVFSLLFGFFLRTERSARSGQSICATGYRRHLPGQ